MRVEQTAIGARAGRVQRALGWRETYDLALAVGLALALPALLPLQFLLLRVPLGLAGVLLAPGYALTAAVFAGHDDIDLPARAALSFGLSAALIPLLALLLDALPWGIRPQPIAIGLAIWIVCCSGVALWRRGGLAAAGQAYLPPAVGGWRAEPARPITRLVVVALVALLIGAATLLLPGPNAPPTEFYLLGRAGLVEDYPREAAPDEELTVQMGIVNSERVARSYRVEVWAARPWAPDQRTLVGQAGPIDIAQGQRDERMISWRMPTAGDDQQVEFLLFIGDDPAPYRQLRLWLDVVERPR